MEVNVNSPVAIHASEITISTKLWIMIHIYSPEKLIHNVMYTVVSKGRNVVSRPTV